MTQGPSTPSETNWAGNHFYAGTIHRPRTVDEAASIVRESRSVRGIGSRHSFTDIADAVDLIDLSEHRPTAGVRCRRTVDRRVRHSVVCGRGSVAAATRGGAAQPWRRCRTSRSPARSRQGLTGRARRTGISRRRLPGLSSLRRPARSSASIGQTPDFEGMVVALGASRRDHDSHARCRLRLRNCAARVRRLAARPGR